ncbi:MAG: CAP domain-containing protein [bacterium]
MAVLLVAFGCLETVSAATQYTNDGVLTAREEVQRWYINRARYGPEHEADRLCLTNTTSGGHPNYDVCEDTTGTNDFGNTSAAWRPWTNSIGPLAPNFKLLAATRKHSRDMAETGLFQHESPSSNYYPLNSEPWERWGVEGYVYDISGFVENISMGGQGGSLGYPADGYAPADSYDDLFIDVGIDNRGHRQGILNPNALEIGVGHCRIQKYSAPWYWTYDYYTEDFSSRTESFFTDTIFCDTNSNHVYDEGEGVSNITIRLYDDATEGAWYDITAAAGGFAVPITAFTAGHSIAVRLRNNGTSRQLTVPTGYATDTNISLQAGAEVTLGTFIHPAGLTNIGLRNLTTARPMSWTIWATGGVNGVISPGGCVQVAAGASATFTNIPDPGYCVSDVLVDGASTGAAAAFTFTSVTTNHVILVSFKEIAQLSTNITAGSDDAEEYEDHSATDVSGLVLNLVEDPDGPDRGRQAVGLRFACTGLPRGVQITNSWIQFTCAASNSADAALTISCQLAGNPQSFVALSGNISARPLTAGTVSWNPSAWTNTGQAGAAQRTPDLSSIMQEVVDRLDWVSTNAIVFVVSGQGSRSAGSVEAGLPPSLHVEWTVKDRDGDAMADDWEIASFGSTNNPNGAAGFDYDGDGLSTLDEYYAGTDPTNKASRFAVIAVGGGTGKFSVVWFGTTNSGAGVPFGIARCTNLASGVWTAAAPVVCRSPTGTNEWSDPAPPSGGVPAFYRPFIVTGGN